MGGAWVSVNVSWKMDTILAIAFVCVGFGALINAFSATLGNRIIYRVASGAFGIMAMEVGVVRYAADRGLTWATPELRQRAFALVVGLCLVSLLIGWIIQVHIERKPHDRNS